MTTRQCDKTIVVKENERVDLKDVDESCKWLEEIVTKAREVNRDLEKHVEVYEKEKGFKIRDIVGFIFYRDRTLVVTPKFSPSMQPARAVVYTLRLFTIMVSTIEGYEPKLPEIYRPLAQEESLQNLDSLLGWYYVNVLNTELKKGVYREYQEYVEDSVFIRGNLMASSLLRNYPVSMTKPIVRYHRLSIDNPLNRVLYRALEELIRVDNSGYRSMLYESLELLSDAEELDYMLNRDIASVKFNRLNERFKHPYMLALLILGYRGVIAREEPFLIAKNMHELFQRYIFTVLRENLDNVGQKKCRISPGNSVFPEVIIPDITVEANGTMIPIDVKYKLLEEDGGKVNPSDFYQVMTYAQFLDSPIAFLVYPRREKDREIDNKECIGCEKYEIDQKENDIKECRKYKSVEICVTMYDFDKILSGEEDPVRALREYNKRFTREIWDIIEEHTGSGSSQSRQEQTPENPCRVE